ncbi:MAG: AmmeMemoRadiSam system protein B [Bacillota bacterium]|nr:AmmeMemoRadiSam system protein B [Bacillota bacterium]
MGEIINSYIFPHPPVIIPEVGNGEEKKAAKTYDSCIKAAGEIKKDNPSTIIVTTPHAPYFQDYLYVSTENNLTGDLKKFGRRDVEFKFKNNSELLDKIITNARNEGINSGGLDKEQLKKFGLTEQLDHGALVPLYFISKELKNFSIIHIAVADFSMDELYNFGKCISSAIEDSDEKVVFVASGDLSHRVNDNSPYGYSPFGSKFDNLFVESIREAHFKRLLTVEEELSEGAAECGLRSFVIMFGALDKYQVTPDVYSYEAPFGIGYCVAKLNTMLS